MSQAPRKVVLRAERHDADSRYLWAWVDTDGRLIIEGQDLGPGTALASSDGEYEWVQKIAAADVPRLVELLGGAPGTDVLDLLEDRYTGRGSYELERLLREGDIPVELSVW